MTAFMEGCRDQTTHEYWVRRKPFGRDIGRPVRIALAIRPDACAHPPIAPETVRSTHPGLRDRNRRRGGGPG